MTSSADEREVVPEERARCRLEREFRSSTRLATVSAVSPFAPLASAKRVPTAFGIPKAGAPRRRPLDLDPAAIDATTPEKPVSADRAELVLERRPEPT